MSSFARSALLTALLIACAGAASPQDTSVDTLVRLLLSSTDPVIRKGIVETLKDREDALPLLLDAWKASSADPQTRALLMPALAADDDARALAVLTGALTGQNDAIRSHAESALASADVDDIRRTLVPPVKTSKSSIQRAAVVSVLKEAIVAHYTAEDGSLPELQRQRHRGACRARRPARDRRASRGAS